MLGHCGNCGGLLVVMVAQTLEEKFDILYRYFQSLKDGAGYQAICVQASSGQVASLTKIIDLDQAVTGTAWSQAVTGNCLENCPRRNDYNTIESNFMFQQALCLQG